MPINCYHTINNTSVNQNEADEIYKEASDYLKRNPNKTAKEALEDILKQRAFNILEAKATAQMDLDKAKAFIDATTAGGNSPVEMLVRTPNAVDQSFNVETYASNHNEDFNSILRKGLSKDEESLLGNANNDLNIVKAFDGTNTDPKFQKIAKNLKEYFTYRDTKLVTSTAFKHNQLLDGYFFRVTHDSSAISKVSEREWVNFVANRLHIPRTTQLLGTSPSNLRKTLSYVYRELESGVPSGDTKGTDLLQPNVSGMAHRSLIFKDLTSQYEYNSKFGEVRDLTKLIRSDFNRSSLQVANAEILGSKPSQFVRNILKDERLFDKGRFGAKRYKDKTVFRTLYNAYYDKAPSVASPTVSGITNTIRTISAIPRLFGALPIYALEDIPQRMLYLRNSGGRLWEAIIAPFVSAMKGTSPQEVEFVKHYVDTFFSESLFNRSGFIAPKFLDSVSKTVYHGFGLKALERNQMKGLIAFRCRQLGENAGKSFSQLDKALVKNLAENGIGTKEWDLIRSSVGNSKYVTPEGIESLPVTSSVKMNLRRKLRSVFLGAANNAVLSNGMYENAVYAMGTKPGTPLGEAVRAVMQFKAFGLNFFRKILVGQMRNAIALDRKLESVLLYASFIVPLSFASGVLLSLSKGLSPTNPFEEKPDAQVGYAEELLLGNLGAMISVINPTGHKSLTEKLLSSPLTKTVNKLYDSVLHRDHIPKNLVKILNLDNTPVISVLLRSAMDNMDLEGYIPEPYKDDSQDYLFD